MGIAKWVGGAALAKLLKYSPQILQAAGEIYRGVKSNNAGAAAGNPPEARLAEIEELQLAQAEVLNRLATQVQELTKALQRSEARLTAALALGGVGFIAGVVAVIVAATR